MKSPAYVLYENRLKLRAELLKTLANGKIPPHPPTLDILNIRDPDGNTALLNLLSSSSLDYLEVSKGAKLDIVDHRFNAVKYLVENGAQVNVSNLEKRTPLGFAFMSCTFELIEYLLSKNAIFDPNHERTLHALAILGADEKIQFLMKIQDTYKDIPSPNINLKDNGGKTPLWRAAELSRLELSRLGTVELLIKLGADHTIVPKDDEMPNAEAIKNIIKNQNSFPIMDALKEVGQKDDVVLEKVKAIVKENPNTLNTMLPYFYQNILHVAAIKGRLNCVRYFLEECNWENAAMALAQEDRYTHNPIESANFENKVHVVKYMADYVSKNKINIELLHRAVQHADRYFLKYLIDECGFDINYQTKGFVNDEGPSAVAVGVGYTALHLTVVIIGEFDHSKPETYKKYQKILDYLMNHPRMDLSIKDKMGRTLLHLAARYQNTKLTQRLLEANVIDINSTFPALCKYENLTALHVAILNPYSNLVGFRNITNENVAATVELLVKHGANPGAVFFEESEVRMPIDYAIHNRFYEAARFLVSQEVKDDVSNSIENLKKIFDMLYQPEYIYPENYYGKRIVLMFENSDQASKMRDYILLMFKISDVQIKNSSLCFPLFKDLKKEDAYLNYFDSIVKADAVVAKHRKLFALLGEHFSTFTMKSATAGSVTYSYFLRAQDVKVVLNNLKVSLSKFKVSVEQFRTKNYIDVHFSREVFESFEIFENLLRVVKGINWSKLLMPDLKIESVSGMNDIYLKKEEARYREQKEQEDEIGKRKLLNPARKLRRSNDYFKMAQRDSEIRFQEMFKEHHQNCYSLVKSEEFRDGSDSGSEKDIKKQKPDIDTGSIDDPRSGGEKIEKLKDNDLIAKKTPSRKLKKSSDKRTIKVPVVMFRNLSLLTPPKPNNDLTQLNLSSSCGELPVLFTFTTPPSGRRGVSVKSDPSKDPSTLYSNYSSSLDEFPPLSPSPGFSPNRPKG